MLDVSGRSFFIRGAVIAACLAVFFAAYTGGLVHESHASVIDDLKKKVEEHNAEIAKLEEEAKKNRAGLATTQERGKTLKEEITRLQANIKRLKNNIYITERKIQGAELQIEELTLEIREKEVSIAKLKDGLAGVIKIFFENDRISAFEALAGQSQFSDFFRFIDYQALLQKHVLVSLTQVKALREDLNVKKKLLEGQRNQAAELRNQLSVRKSSLTGEQEDQTKLLSVTKQQEKLYQDIIRGQDKKKLLLEQEIKKLEEQIRITIDPASLPRKGTGVMGWPLPDVSIASCWNGGGSFKNCITQFFGYTQFAAAGAYNGKGHNGADFRADIGTPVLASSGGIVEAVGDTDAGCRGASYGKWVLLKHNNNLSTLYAHLSQIGVSKGQQAGRGDKIALSGKSGYATGPHLHFGMYVTQGVQVTSIRSVVCGTMMTLPIAAINAYLNPLDYL